MAYIYNNNSSSPPGVFEEHGVYKIMFLLFAIEGPTKIPNHVYSCICSRNQVEVTSKIYAIIELGITLSLYYSCTF